MEEISAGMLRMIHSLTFTSKSLVESIAKLISVLVAFQSVHFLRSNKNSDVVSIPELEITLERIIELAEEEEEDEYGEVIVPSEYATQAAIEVVSLAAKSISDRFFKAWVSTEDSGGVVLTWSKPELDKKVRLVIPPIPDRKIYLYHEMAEEYGIEYNVSAKTLSEWLSWCNSK